jgi:hypothetical protein
MLAGEHMFCGGPGREEKLGVIEDVLPPSVTLTSAFTLSASQQVVVRHCRLSVVCRVVSWIAYALKQTEGWKSSCSRLDLSEAIAKRDLPTAHVVAK